jgi:hypothetical protein
MIERNEAQYGNAIPREEAKNLYPEQKRIEDPWKHRSKGMVCDTCIWFVPKERTTSLGLSNIGRCRRHAPTMGGYPVVYMTDWCGDHRLDENKA